MIGRVIVVVASVAAGAAAGALVFKMVGEDRLGGEIRVVTTRLGFKPKPGDDSALNIIEAIAPGTRAGFESAIVGTVVAALIAATATTIIVREVVGS